MDGPEFVKWIETTLIQNDIPKEVFYAESGISTANMSQWRSGEFKPSPKSIAKAKSFFEKCAEKKKSPASKDAELSDFDVLQAYNKADEVTQALIRRALGLE